jgi:3D (Asp-Asp-Asp) domain-containing protein
MRRIVNTFALGLAAFALAACAGRPLPKYEPPLARAPVLKVRTTAYTHTEADHTRHGRRNALGTELQSGPINSAAADWSRFPAGTVFRIKATGEIFRVDDYGWMLAGTNTIDLYKPSRQAMNAWGVRRVTIEILEWGDVKHCYAVLKPREKYRHVRRMVRQIENRYL